MSSLTRAVIRSLLILGVVLAISIFAARTLGCAGMVIAIVLPLAAVIYVWPRFQTALIQSKAEAILDHAADFYGCRFETESVSPAPADQIRSDWIAAEDVSPCADQTFWFVVGTLLPPPSGAELAWNPMLLDVDNIRSDIETSLIEAIKHPSPAAARLLEKLGHPGSERGGISKTINQDSVCPQDAPAHGPPTIQTDEPCEPATRTAETSACTTHYAGQKELCGDAPAADKLLEKYQEQEDVAESEPRALALFAVDRWDGSQWVAATGNLSGPARLRLHVGRLWPVALGYLSYASLYDLGTIRFQDPS